MLLPNTKIVWSDILMRRYWHKERDVIRRPNIRSTEINIYRHDGTHLSDTGNAVYLNNVQEAIEYYLNNVQGAIEYFLVSDSRTLFPPQ